MSKIYRYFWHFSCDNITLDAHYVWYLLFFHYILIYLALRNGSHDAGPFDCGICQRKGQSFPWKDLVLWSSLKSLLLSQEISSESLSISSIESIIPTISLSAQATDLLIMVILIYLACFLFFSLIPHCMVWHFKHWCNTQGGKRSQKN